MVIRDEIKKMQRQMQRLQTNVSVSQLPIHSSEWCKCVPKSGFITLLLTNYLFTDFYFCLIVNKIMSLIR